MSQVGVRQLAALPAIVEDFHAQSQVGLRPLSGLFRGDDQIQSERP